jgi:diguanylate cyclase (GGDEF)-like protein
MRIETVLELPGRLPKPILTILAFLLVLTIGSIDLSAGYNNVSIALLYLFPIILITWFEGGIPAAIIAIFSAITWSIADAASGPVYSHMSIPIWNSVMVLGMFSLVAYCFATIKKLLIKERAHSLNDGVTHTASAAVFYEEGQREIKRAARYKRPLTLARLGINDHNRLAGTLGQHTAESLLRAVAETVIKTLRTTDIVGRLEAHEFALLMPETKSKEAEVAIHKVQEHLLDMVKQNGWPVTFSIGVVTCTAPTCTIDTLITIAGDLMRTAQDDAGKRVQYRIVDSPAAAS